MKVNKSTISHSEQYSSKNPRSNNVYSNSNRDDLFYVRYQDHVFFKNADSQLFNPVVRECCGWKVRENDIEICILFDRSVKPLPYEKNSVKETGLCILKNDILEIKKIV